MRFSSALNDAPPIDTVAMNCSIVYCLGVPGAAFAVLVAAVAALAQTKMLHKSVAAISRGRGLNMRSPDVGRGASCARAGKAPSRVRDSGPAQCALHIIFRSARFRSRSILSIIGSNHASHFLRFRNSRRVFGPYVTKRGSGRSRYSSRSRASLSPLRCLLSTSAGTG